MLAVDQDCTDRPEEEHPAQPGGHEEQRILVAARGVRDGPVDVRRPHVAKDVDCHGGHCDRMAGKKEDVPLLAHGREKIRGSIPTHVVAHG